MIKWKVVFLLAAVLLGFNTTFCRESQAAEDSKANSQTKRPECIETLLKASSFDDAAVGEAAERTQTYLAYQKAGDMIGGLADDDLIYLSKNGTAAGRLYGAVLMKQSGRFGNEQAFGHLLDDKEMVKFRSGCKGRPVTVGEMAKSLMKDCKFESFRFSIFCKLKAPVKNQ
ncbi:MAG: hypothetical protein K2X27_15205 [Candidatus Obscuribacterales bacterium]|nr:hypothetical protein [Candidatus Obscuribacterales bacterium]